jgi:hypothetical protein
MAVGAGEHARAEAVVRQARDMLAANERLDMARLSEQFGVDRTTLFRWVGNRDRLLVEVLWSIAEPLFRECVAAAEGTGAAYLSRVVGRWVAGTHRSAEFRAVVVRDPDRALRLFAARSGELRARFCALVEALVRREVQAGSFDHPLAPGELAELMTRICDAYVWADLLAGDEPDAVGAQVAVGLLLRPEPGNSA